MDANDARLSVFGHSEGHLWGVSSEKLSFIGHTGILAIVLRESEPDSLSRVWHFYDLMDFISLVTSRNLEGSEISLVVDRAKSPHLKVDNLKIISQLSDEERESIDKQIEDCTKLKEDFRKDMEELLTASRYFPDAYFKLIN